MSLLLDLPFEIRAHIIDLIIFHCQEKPDLNTVNEYRTKMAEQGVSGWWMDGYRTAPELYMTNTAALLQANHQLHSETIKRLALYRTRAEFELDIVITDDDALFHTWLRLPVVTNDVEVLNVTFRSLGDNDIPNASGRNSDGSVWFSPWMDNTLERILKLGALHPNNDLAQLPGYTVDESSHHTFVNNLNVNVESFVGTSTSSVSAETCLKSSDSPIASSESIPAKQDRRLTRNSARFARFICGWVELLLAIPYGTPRYGRIVYRNIGTIRVYVDGRLMRKMDLGQSLAFFPQHRYSGVYSLDKQFDDWRERTITTRKSKGLPLPDMVRHEVSE